MNVGRYGVWAGGPRLSPPIAAEIENLGFATTSIAIATGIVNIWQAPADEVAASYRRTLAPEHKVVLVDDPVAARAIGRPPFDKPYLSLTNYVANLERLGYSDADVARPGSDRLIDDLVAHGSAAEVAAKVSAHLAAGADHVCLQVIPRPGDDDATLPSLRSLAPALDF